MDNSDSMLCLYNTVECILGHYTGQVAKWEHGCTFLTVFKNIVTRVELTSEKAAMQRETAIRQTNSCSTQQTDSCSSKKICTNYRGVYVTRRKALIPMHFISYFAQGVAFKERTCYSSVSTRQKSLRVISHQTLKKQK